MRERLLLPLAGLPVLLVIAWMRVRSGVPRRRAVLEALFGVYVLLAASMVFLPVYLDPTARLVHAESAARFGSGWFNPVPFRTIGSLPARPSSTQLTLAIGNLGLLLPLGALAPAAFPQLRDWRTFAASALCAAVFIEAAQFAERAAHLAFRSVDVDDVILNTLGALVGFAVFSCIDRVAAHTGARRGVGVLPAESAVSEHGGGGV